MPKREYSVIVPKNVFPKPSMREMSAAYILLDYFKTDVEFIPRNNQKTPDFMIGGIKWELKTPVGTGKYNIQHLLHTAIQQPENIIVDTRFSRMHFSKIINELKRHSVLTTKGIKNLIVITKSRKIVVAI